MNTTCAIFFLLCGFAFIPTAQAKDTSGNDTVPPLVVVTFNLDDIAPTNHRADRLKEGYVDESGTWRVLPRWDQSGVFHFSDGLARVRIGDTVRYLDPSGAVHRMNHKYLFQGWGQDGFICKKYAQASEPRGPGLAGTWNRIIDRQGELALPGIPSPTWMFQIKDRCITISGEKYAEFFFDVERGELGSERFQSVGGFKPINPDRSIYFARVKLNDAWGFLDERGKIAIRPQWIEAWDFGETGLARVRGDEGWVYIDATGAVVIPAKPDQIYRDDFSFGYAVVNALGGGEGYIDRQGEWAFGKQFDRAEPFGPNGLAAARENGLWGYINSQGRWAIPPSLFSAYTFKAVGSGFVARVTDKNHCLRLIDSSGNFLPNFDAEARRFQSEKCPMRIEGWKSKMYSFFGENLPTIAIGCGVLVLMGTWLAYRRTGSKNAQHKNDNVGISVFHNLGRAAIFGFISVACAGVVLDEICSVSTLSPYFRDVHRDSFYVIVFVLWVLNLVLLMGLRGIANAISYLRRR